MMTLTERTIHHKALSLCTYTAVHLNHTAAAPQYTDCRMYLPKRGCGAEIVKNAGCPAKARRGGGGTGRVATAKLPRCARLAVRELIEFRGELDFERGRIARCSAATVSCHALEARASQAVCGE